MKPFVYLAGPYTKPEPVENINRAVLKAEQLQEEYNVWVLVPHLTAFWHLITPHDYQHWLDYDIELMRRCDVVYRMSGDSNGADNEVVYAERIFLPVVYTDDDLEKWLANRHSDTWVSQNIKDLYTA